jgi:hypothetical protein
MGSRLPSATHAQTVSSRAQAMTPRRRRGSDSDDACGGIPRDAGVRPMATTRSKHPPLYQGLHGSHGGCCRPYIVHRCQHFATPPGLTRAPRTRATLVLFPGGIASLNPRLPAGTPAGVLGDVVLRILCMGSRRQCRRLPLRNARHPARRRGIHTAGGRYRGG